MKPYQPDPAVEQQRHEHEVRFVLAMPTREQRATYLDGVQARRGQAAADRLRRDVSTAWQQRRQSLNQNSK